MVVVVVVVVVDVVGVVGVVGVVVVEGEVVVNLSNLLDIIIIHRFIQSFLIRCY